MESIFPHKLWKHSTCSIKKCFKSKVSCGALHCKRSALFACEASLHILLSASPRPEKCAECTSYLTKLFISCFYCHTAATNCYSLCTKYHVNPICGLRAGWRWHNICAFAYGDPEWPRNSAFKISGFIFSLKSNWTSTNMQKNVSTLAAQSQVMYYNVKVLWLCGQKNRVEQTFVDLKQENRWWKQCVSVCRELDSECIIATSCRGRRGELWRVIG